MRGVVLDARASSDTHDTALRGAVPLLDVVATHDPVHETMTVLVVNRPQSEAAPVRIGFAGFTVAAVSVRWTPADDDPRVTNSAEQPDRVGPQTNGSPTIVSPGGVTLGMPPVSWTLLALTGRVLDVFAAASS